MSQPHPTHSRTESPPLAPIEQMAQSTCFNSHDVAQSLLQRRVSRSFGSAPSVSDIVTAASAPVVTE